MAGWVWVLVWLGVQGVGRDGEPSLMEIRSELEAVAEAPEVKGDVRRSWLMARRAVKECELTRNPEERSRLKHVAWAGLSLVLKQIEYGREVRALHGQRRALRRAQKRWVALRARAKGDGEPSP